LDTKWKFRFMTLARVFFFAGKRGERIENFRVLCALSVFNALAAAIAHSQNETPAVRRASTADSSSPSRLSTNLVFFCIMRSASNLMQFVGARARSLALLHLVYSIVASLSAIWKGQIVANKWRKKGHWLDERAGGRVERGRPCRSPFCLVARCSASVACRKTTIKIKQLWSA